MPQGASGLPVEVDSDTIVRTVLETYPQAKESETPIRDPRVAVKLLKKDFKLLVDETLVTLVFASFLESKPVLFEGPPGTGKTEIGEALLKLWSGRSPFVLPCSENYDEYRVVGDFHPLKAFKFGFNEKSFTPRPLLAALLIDAGVLVDEIRRSSEEFQNLLLDIIDKRRIIIPELKKTYRANGLGFQFIFTSNPFDIGQTELSDAFLRRVIRIGFEYPDKKREKEIIRLRLGKFYALIDEELVDRTLQIVNELRELDISYKPGVSETVTLLLIAARLAEYRKKPRVEITELREASYPILVKSDEDKEQIMEVIESYL